MKKLFFFFPLFFAAPCFSLYAFAQLDSAYIYTYGGNNDDYARQIISTNDSGYIVVGTTSSFGVALTDIYIIKTDRNAVRQWSHIYGSPGIDWGYAIRETYDNGYIVTGYTNQNNGSGYDIYLLKIDSAGNVEWTKTIGGNDWDFGYGIELTPDSGFIIIGKSYSFSNGGSDAYIVKTNSTGDVMWQKNYGGTNDESANGIIRDRDNNFAIVGETSSYGFGDHDIWMLKINLNGDTLWTKTYGTTLFDAGYAIDTTLDGNYITNGTSNGFSTDSSTDMILIKTTSSGTWKFTRIHGENLHTEDGRIVKQFPNGNIFDGGTTDAYGVGKTAFYMLRNDSAGNFINGCAFGGTDYEEGYSVAVGKDNQVVFAGISNSYGCGLFDVYLIRIDTFTIVNDYILSIHEFCDSTIGVPETIAAGNNISVYPNPATKIAYINLTNKAAPSALYTLAVTDLAGREIMTLEKVKFPAAISLENLQSGIYFVEILQDTIPLTSAKLIVY